MAKEIGQVLHDGKMRSMVHLPKAKALVIGETIFGYNENTWEEDAFLLSGAENITRRRYLLMGIHDGQGGGKVRLIIRSGIIMPGSPQQVCKYYVDFPCANVIPRETIVKLQRWGHRVIAWMRKRRLLATCMAFHNRLGSNSLLGHTLGMELIQMVVAPFIMASNK